jgi:cyclic pyranopterin phosphate synthase
MITRRENTTEKAIKAVDKAIELGVRTKLNVVAMRNFNDDELLDFVEFVKNRPVEVRFIEFMPFDKN